MALRPGFVIPAAGTTTANLPASQPDQGDFLTLGNQRYGVIAGCDVSFIAGGAGQPGTVRMGSGPNILKVNDQTYVVSGNTQATVSTTVGSGDRIDIVVFDTNNGFTVVTGTPAQDPVMPDLTASMTLLFMLYVQLVNAKVTVIDKRLFLGRSLASQVDANSTLIENRDANGAVLTRVLGDGTLQWRENDAYIKRTGVNEVTINSKLVVGQIQAGSIAVGAGSPVTSEHWGRGAALPPYNNRQVGDWYTLTTSGATYVRRPNGWEALAFSGSTMPVGTYITSELDYELNKDTVLAGFLPVDGRTLTYDDYPAYFEAKGRHSGSITLPDATGCVLAVPHPGVAAIGDVFGRSSNLVGLQIANLPEHIHESSNFPLTGEGGEHTPQGTATSNGRHGHTASGGEHRHEATDRGHQHDPPWGPGDGLGYMVDSPNCHQNSRGGPIGSLEPSTTMGYPAFQQPPAADGARNTGYLCSPAEKTGNGCANIVVSTTGSAHPHDISEGGAHFHLVQMEPVPPHRHPMPPHVSVGHGEAFDITPRSLAVNIYVKVA